MRTDTGLRSFSIWTSVKCEHFLKAKWDRSKLKRSYNVNSQIDGSQINLTQCEHPPLPPTLSLSLPLSLSLSPSLSLFLSPPSLSLSLSLFPPLSLSLSLPPSLSFLSLLVSVHE